MASSSAALAMHKLILNEKIHTEVVQEIGCCAEKFVWIATADIKDMHIKKGRRFVPFLNVLADLVSSGVAVRIIHAKEPGPRFRDDFDKYPELIESDLFERVLCPRNHTKAIIVDGKTLFLGSASLTGAGLGGKSPKKRNFEAGILTDESSMIEAMMEWFDELYIGSFCRACQLRNTCPDPLDSAQ